MSKSIFFLFFLSSQSKIFYCQQEKGGKNDGQHCISLSKKLCIVNYLGAQINPFFLFSGWTIKARFTAASE